MFSEIILYASNSYRVLIFDHSHRVVYTTLWLTTAVLNCSPSRFGGEGELCAVTRPRWIGKRVFSP